MLHVELQRSVNVCIPGAERLFRETVHEVDADVVQTVTTQLADGFFHLPCGVPAAQEAQSFVGESLCPHADAVHGQGRQLGGVVGAHVVGVAFDGYFSAVADIVYLIYMLEELAQQTCGKLRRGSSAEVDGVDER